MNFISVLLRLSEVKKAVGTEIPEGADKIGYGYTQQYRIYEMQENALRIAANWDVQDHIFKFMGDGISESLPNDAQNDDISWDKVLKDAYKVIDNILIKINSDMIIREINSSEERHLNKIRFNGVGPSFQYASWTNAMIGDVDIAQCMLKILLLNTKNTRMNPKQKSVKEPGKQEETGVSDPDAQAKEAAANLKSRGPTRSSGKRKRK